MQVGILEFRDNPFIREVAGRLADLGAEYIRLGELAHPRPPRHRLIIDRVSFADPYLAAVLRYWSRAGVYVINNPFFALVTDKLSELLTYDKLGIRYPVTVALPRTNRTEDVRELVAEPDLEEVESRVGFPCILKPVDGYAWQDVFRVENPTDLRTLYESLRDSRILIAQQLIPYRDYLRAFCVDNREVMLVRWKPFPFDRGEYSSLQPGELADLRADIEEKTAGLTREQGLDFNSVEWAITPQGTAVVIDSYNDVPDVRPEKLPAECYAWIVDRFCACVRGKLAAGRTNPIPGLPPEPSQG